ncbi:serine hydrolase domain-containing protein [Mucilaginibacter lappiensis]|uniref:CubicO group peptidase (Beta-lactamase class C family) n=2 Tax=Mucilaginibacter lappiensis TaxID=354630 RepID=A0A1N7D2Y2_9SPHI|nr:serine hydrolase domain-containing protein [Mucilaginibacter lappiensis]MBB6111144.1 CubicO group peptidase (beta-lactamase class C family) [Mucilaginibacter lappiensis]MBB6128732.1 CubicO group peptidase (beta-lactamase class C family) [Mucilaginibacter lappiensis]SIR70201.1 CubicO group peptidase, beta-lactamase class C family [Mucilaginibacter lappiensis]
MKKILLLLLFVSTGFGTWAQGVTLQVGNPASEKFSVERLQRIDHLIESNIDSGYINGAVGFIARNGKIVYHKSFGIADVEQKKLMDNDNIFRIASQTKAITSVAVMMLFEEGKFLLDEPISKYIPAFAHPKVIDLYNEKDTTYTTVPAKREITIRDLLTHTSGIEYAQIGSPRMNAIYAKSKIPGGFVADKIRLADAMDRLGKLPLTHQPGEKWTYGLNIDVLGYLVEKVSGKTLDQFFKERIFDPLGMKDTYFYIPAAKQNRLVAVYTPDKQGHLVKWSASTLPGIDFDYPKATGTYFSGGAGLSSTIKDYATFLQMMLNGGIYNGQRLLARHTVEMMTENQIGDLYINADKDKFGLGFGITTPASSAKLGISPGSFAWGGFYGTLYWVDPKEHLVCLLFIQNWPLPHYAIQDKFRALVYQALAD